jgi:hypothetical protein
MSNGLDPRLVLLRLADSWRLGAIIPTFSTCPTCGQRPCPDPAFCNKCSKADREIRTARRCAQCGASAGLQPRKDIKAVAYLHKDCLPFRRKTHR